MKHLATEGVVEFQGKRTLSKHVLLLLVSPPVLESETKCRDAEITLQHQQIGFHEL